MAALSNLHAPQMHSTTRSLEVCSPRRHCLAVRRPLQCCVPRMMMRRRCRSPRTRRQAAAMKRDVACVRRGSSDTTFIACNRGLRHRTDTRIFLIRASHKRQFDFLSSQQSAVCQSRETLHAQLVVQSSSWTTRTRTQESRQARLKPNGKMELAMHVARSAVCHALPYDFLERAQKVAATDMVRCSEFVPKKQNRMS